MKIIAYMTAILTEVFIFVDKKKRINHYDLLFAFTVESSTNHSRDSRKKTIFIYIEIIQFRSGEKLLLSTLIIDDYNSE